ncbi:Uncharacterised protein [Bordetella pertussis]|nr:Uncharacterised protein [Bordetella pertussis]CPN00426.1 Uncharacterised protein [Bordetella pertussis]
MRGSCSTGVMSRNVTPGVGQSGTLRMVRRTSSA